MDETKEKSLDSTAKSPREVSTPKSITVDIKERLNLHLKRRLQNSVGDQNTQNKTSSTKNKNEVKPRKQYIKRTEKFKNSIAGKRGRRLKLVKQAIERSTKSSSERERRSWHSGGTSRSEGESPGDDEASLDESGQNTDLLQSPKEKERQPDILNLVLSVKKRALFCDPEVLRYFRDFLDALWE